MFSPGISWGLLSLFLIFLVFLVISRIVVLSRLPAHSILFYFGNRTIPSRPILAVGIFLAVSALAVLGVVSLVSFSEIGLPSGFREEITQWGLPVLSISPALLWLWLVQTILITPSKGNVLVSGEKDSSDGFIYRHGDVFTLGRSEKQFFSLNEKESFEVSVRLHAKEIGKIILCTRIFRYSKEVFKGKISLFDPSSVYGAAEEDVLRKAVHLLGRECPEDECSCYTTFERCLYTWVSDLDIEEVSDIGYEEE